MLKLRKRRQDHKISFNLSLSSPWLHCSQATTVPIVLEMQWTPTSTPQSLYENQVTDVTYAIAGHSRLIDGISLYF